MEDSEIVNLYWERKETAVSESRIKYGKLLFRIAYNILQNHEDSEECESETYIRAWNSIPPNMPESLKAYLGRIVRNFAFHYWEKQNAKKRGEGNLLFSELSEMIPDRKNTEEAVELRELTCFLEKWLGALEKEERILFMRRYWYGDSIKELAAALKTAPNKLAGKMFRLRERLRKDMEKEGITV